MNLCWLGLTPGCALEPPSHPGELPTGSGVSVAMSLRPCVRWHLQVCPLGPLRDHPHASGQAPELGRQALSLGLCCAVPGAVLASRRGFPRAPAPLRSQTPEIAHLFAANLLPPALRSCSRDNVSRTCPPLSGGRRRVESDAFCPVYRGVSSPTASRLC